MGRDVLSEYYTRHHTEEGRLGYSWGEAERAEYFKDWIGKGRRVLDIGCRDGTLTKHYCDDNEVIGVDIDLNALELCRKRLNIQLLCADANKELPFSDGFFDVVVLAEVLEHTMFPELVLAESYRILRMDGMLIGSTPNAFRLKNRIKFVLGQDFELDKTHLHHFSLKGLRQLLESRFSQVFLLPISSHFLFLSKNLFGNSILWRCYKN